MIVTRKRVGDGGPCFLGSSAFRGDSAQNWRLQETRYEKREGCVNLVNPEELTGNPRLTS